MKECLNPLCEAIIANKHRYCPECAGGVFSPIKSNPAPVAKLHCSAGLSCLVRLNPKISGTEESPEPSIGELITKYYADQGMEDPVKLTANYLAELARMAR